MTTPVCDFVQAYAEKGVSRFHMPGHKGAKRLGFEQADITEIFGADALYEADGILRESEENAGRLFGFGKTLYGTEGSSQCIRAMLFLALQGTEKKAGERPLILAARNAHKAFLYSCALLDLDVEWLMPEKRNSLCSCPVEGTEVERKLSSMEKKPFALYLTSPDYLGYRSDLKEIAAVCRKYGISLLVDNAHGAYLKFLQPSEHPLDLGASMSCDSAHKTLPVLTGGAYLQLSREWAEKVGEQAKGAMEIFGSTSPSYLILQSLDHFNREAAESFPEKLKQTCERTARLKSALTEQGWDVFCGEPLKLTVSAAKAGLTGEKTAMLLREKGVECEFADLETVVLMASVDNSEEDFLRVERIFETIPKGKALVPAELPAFVPKAVLSAREALFAGKERVPAEKSEGRICASPCVSCPPAIPIAVSGEEISKEMIEIFRAYGVDEIEVVK